MRVHPAWKKGAWGLRKLDVALKLREREDYLGGKYEVSQCPKVGS